VPQVTSTGLEEPAPKTAKESVDEIREAFWIVGRSMGQVRVHERLLRAAGVRIDRAGGALLYMLLALGESVRVTGLADLLGVDAPSVTRKIQQLEREGLVARHADPKDHRATRIGLTDKGRKTLERVLKARRAWFDRLLEGWDDRDLANFAAMLGRFATSLERDLEDARGV
jgi:DNA-binding MarR family transcriptional regulator